MPVRKGAICSSVVRAFAHDAMGRRIDPSWVGPIKFCEISLLSAFRYAEAENRTDLRLERDGGPW